MSKKAFFIQPVKNGYIVYANMSPASYNGVNATTWDEIFIAKDLTEVKSIIKKNEGEISALTPRGKTLC